MPHREGIAGKLRTDVCLDLETNVWNGR